MPSRKVLVLTLDAFSTIYTPKSSIFTQYLSLARQCDLPLDIPSQKASKESDIEKVISQSFRTTFKKWYGLSPNYGRATGMKPEEWWNRVVKGTFAPLVPQAGQSGFHEGPLGEDEVEAKMMDLCRRLYKHFSSRDGYAMFEDSQQLFDHLQAIKHGQQSHGNQLLVGVLTNSDPRITPVLRSLGLKVSDVTASNVVPDKPPATGEDIDISLDTDPDHIREPAANDIDFVITSYEAGSEKPDPAIFGVVETVAKDLLSQRDHGSTSIQHLHIGDDYDKDVVGGRGVGWEAWHLDRGLTKERKGQEEISRLDSPELLGFIEEFLGSD